MKVFSVIGLTGSGKTTTIEAIIKELKARGKSVGTVKEIHYEAFKIDTEGKNTYRHRMAGADTVTARAHNETDIMFKGHVDIYEVLKNYSEDYVVLEGVRDALVPNIYVCKEEEEPKINCLTIAVSGRFSNNDTKSVGGLPVINAEKNPSEIVNLIERKAPDLWPNVREECCGLCGENCERLLSKYLAGEVDKSKCVLSKSNVSLKLDGRDIVIVPFVQGVIEKVVKGLVSELKGFKDGSQIEIKIK